MAKNIKLCETRGYYVVEDSEAQSASASSILGALAVIASLFVIPFYTPIGVFQVLAGWIGLAVSILVWEFFKRIFKSLTGGCKINEINAK